MDDADDEEEAADDEEEAADDEEEAPSVRIYLPLDPDDFLTRDSRCDRILLSHFLMCPRAFVF